MSESNQADLESSAFTTQSERWCHLMIRSREGEPDLFGLLTNELSGMLRLRLRRDPQTQALASNAHDIEDVLQDTFLRLWKHRDRFDPAKGEVGAWAWIIARNQAVSLLRQRRPSARASQVEAVEDRRAEQPDRALLAQEEQQALTDALDRVARPKVRQVLHLRLVAGLPYTEVSAATGVPVGTVANWVHRLRRTLRDDTSRAA